jgi:hypothetical protein
MILADFNHPGALADREAAERHGVAGVEFALSPATALLGIRHRYRKRCRAQDDPRTGQATSKAI